MTPKSVTPAARQIFQKTTLALAITSSLAPQLSYAGPDVSAEGPELAINTHTIGSQTDVQVAIDADGDFVMTWTSYGQDGSGLGVYARAFNADGSPKTSEFRVNEYTTNDQGAPQVAMDADGDFALAWRSRGQDGSGFGVYARAYHADGTPKTAEERLANTHTVNNQSEPRLAMDDVGNFVVIWQSDGQDGDRYGIYGRRFSAAGLEQDSEFRLNTHTAGAQENARIAMDADGDFAVTWTSNGQDGSNNGIYARAYNADGSSKSHNEFLVNSYTTGRQEKSEIAMDTDGDFAVTWMSYGQDGSSDGIYSRAFDATGTAKVSGEIRVNVAIANNQSAQKMAMDADGDFAVTWHSASQDGSADGVYARVFNSDGTVKSDEFRVNDHTTSTQNRQQIAMDADGDFAVTWRSYGQDGAIYGVYVRAFDADGTAKASGEIRANTYVASVQSEPKIVMDADGDFVVAWQSYDQDGSGYGIYSQRFAAAAAVETDLTVAVSSSVNPTPGYAEVNGSVTYTYTVNNVHATGAASGAGLDFRLPTGFVYDTFMGTGWSCTHTPPLACDYTPSIPAGNRADPLYLTLTAPATPIRANLIAKARSTETDSAPGNNGVSALTVVCDPHAVDSLKLTSASVSEAIGTATLKVTRSGGACSAASVTTATNNLTASAGEDYATTFSHLNWAATEQGPKTYTVAIHDDALDERVEFVALSLLDGSPGTTLGPAGKLIILDDDASPTVSFSSGDQSISETGGLATITATLSQASGQNVTIPLTLTGTAINRTDYKLSPTRIIIPAGNLSASATVMAVSDTTHEGDETAILSMGTVRGATPTGTTSNIVTITDDDLVVPTIGFVAASSNYREGSAGNGGVARITLSSPSTSPVTVMVSVTGGTATLDSDYSLNNGGLITIPAGQTSVPTAFVLDDAEVEPTERVTLQLSSPSGAVLGSVTSHTLNIFDVIK